MPMNTVNTRRALTTMGDLATALLQAREDGRFSYADLRFFIKPLFELPEAVFGAHAIPGEIEGMGAIERAQLQQEALSDIALPEGTAQEFAEVSIDALLAIAKLISLIEGGKDAGR